jgi:hypothetical protein
MKFRQIIKKLRVTQFRPTFRAKNTAKISLNFFRNSCSVYLYGCVPILEDVPGLGRHTVDAPVGAALLVADGDAEPAVVGPDDLYELPLCAGHLQLLALARVSGADARQELTAWIYEKNY